MHRLSVGTALVGLLEGLLLLRLVALLFAARPDHPIVVLLLSITTPLTAPFRWLDQLAGQPQFGARLDLATLSAMVVALVLAALIQLVVQRRDD